ncbi:MAG: hypothetical protein HLUCCA11_23660 [Phormidesmis priestleyi Ana]|uniref:Uncharacterized protein n=1 Tax=Phormidesmis priestleyi Ana TaxID=1666911 RepID=A0A0P7YMG3_9CYAN|nr:MAG: hypothetical protein HLUCCA11_23660 [Phormidesmis priestleyi Ana]
MSFGFTVYAWKSDSMWLACVPDELTVLPGVDETGVVSSSNPVISSN